MTYIYEKSETYRADNFLRLGLGLTAIPGGFLLHALSLTWEEIYSTFFIAKAFLVLSMLWVGIHLIIKSYGIMLNIDERNLTNG